MSINNPRNPLKSSGSSLSGELLDIYSTDERRIGTWIDGKPLYRKVIKTTSPASVSANSQVILRLDENVRVVRYDAYVDTDTLFSKLSVVDGTTNKASYVWFSNYNIVYMFVSHSTYASKPVVLIIEYTKTTDQTEG